MVGDSLVLATVWKNASLRSPSYIILCGLAFTDLFTGLVIQPLYVTVMIMCLRKGTENQPLLSMNLVFVMSFCGAYFVYLSLSLVTLMSVERWLHMARRSLLTVRRTLLITSVGTLLLIPVTLIKLVAPPLLYTVIFFVTLTFYILATSTAYFEVFLIIRRHQQKVEANQFSQNRFSQSAIDVLKYKKSVFTILCILGVFYVSYSPFLIIAGIYIFRIANRATEVGKMISMLFLCLSSSLNPAIYIWRMNDIRIGVKKLLKKLFWV